MVQVLVVPAPVLLDHLTALAWGDVTWLWEEVLGGLITVALIAAVRWARRRQPKTSRVIGADCLSILNVICLTAWLAMYELAASQNALGAGIHGTQRFVLGGAIIFHYLLSGLDRIRRGGMSWCGCTAPFLAAGTAAVIVVWPGNFYTAAPVAIAAVLYFVGYLNPPAYGRYAFGVPMLISALVGAVLVAIGQASTGELFLVLAGIIAGLRSIAAFIGQRDSRASAPTTPRAANPKFV